MDAMRLAYPKDARVRVCHSRGSFAAVVEGWDRYGVRIAVRNLSTNKASKWWAAHVELMGDTPPGVRASDGQTFPPADADAQEKTE